MTLILTFSKPGQADVTVYRWFASVESTIKTFTDGGWTLIEKSGDLDAYATFKAMSDIAAALNLDDCKSLKDMLPQMKELKDLLPSIKTKLK